MAAPVLRVPGLFPPLRAPLRGCLGPCRVPGSPGAVPVPAPVPVPVPVRAMAGHNRWSKVRNVKGPRDAERSRLLEKMARMLRAAAREGGADPALNPGLAAVVAQCRTLNVPKATIEGALRSVRERPAGAAPLLLTARGPGGSLVLLDVRTDNVRRSQAELRTLLQRHGATLTPDVHPEFQAVGVVRVSGRTLGLEAALDVAAVAGAQDVTTAGDEIQGLVMVVTGGSGFLGSHLAQVLLDWEPELRELRILDLEPDIELVPERHRSRVRLLRGDVTDLGALRAAFGGAAVVFHSAALVDVWGRCSAEAVARVNVLGTKNVIRACQASGVPVLIFTSSMEVVGPNTRGDPFVRGDEESPYPSRHSEPYPLSKAPAERLLLEANGKPISGGGRLVTLSLRPTGIFGERHPLLELFYRRGRGLGGLLPRTLPQNAEHGRVYAGEGNKWGKIQENGEKNPGKMGEKMWGKWAKNP
ncbi:uncharacterized protein LOC141727960, partial [Zonotrichia albicollis]|uniref:uncharacterized protein LOC141727960 n=1 Tax=Zonotrichia albicollis TaxID=44394 RepID=UPI003D810B71